jgi:CYTH domain-containing protein
LAVRQKVVQLRSQVERRRAALQSLKNNLKAQHAHRELEHQKELAVAQKKWARMHKSMVTTRRVLVNELVSLFEIQYQGNGDETLVICNVTIPNHLINVSSKY